MTIARVGVDISVRDSRGAELGPKFCKGGPEIKSSAYKDLSMELVQIIHGLDLDLARC